MTLFNLSSKENPAVFLFNVMVQRGQFEIVKHFRVSNISDRRLQALMIIFSFGSILSSIAGFRTPVAIMAVKWWHWGLNRSKKQVFVL